MDSLVDTLERVRGDTEAAEAEVAALQAEIEVTRAAIVGSAIDASQRRLRRLLRAQVRTVSPLAALRAVRAAALAAPEAGMAAPLPAWCEGPRAA